MFPRRLKIRFAILAILSLAPVAFLAIAGSYYLYRAGLSFYVYWPMAGCWLAAYLLGRYWTRRQSSVLNEAAEVPTPEYWTDRDQAAWKIVEQYVAELKPVPTEQMSDLNRYATEAQDLAMKIARIYQPTAADPFGHLTLPEIMTCGELVSADMARLIRDYIPGSHLLSINDLRWTRDAVEQATVWYPRLRNLYWAASAIFNPIKTGMQVVATKAGLAPAFAGFQQNVLLWFHTTYVKELGRYLIELNSGRLKVGAQRYRELMAQHQAPPTVATPETPPTDRPATASLPPVVVAIVGPVKAGKSSLVNAILGEARAATDVLLLTAGVTQYRYQPESLPELTLHDTAGFGNDGPSDADVRAAVDAARNADVLLLVVPARSAARQPESQFLDRVRAVLASQPDLKLPPVLLVLSHVDLLTPAAEWAPPYNWRNGTRTKEVTIRDAAEAAGEVFAGRTVATLPVCTSPGREWGVQDELIPAIAVLLGEARGIALLRTIHKEATADKTRRVMNQIVNVGGHVLRTLWENAKKPPS